MSDHLRIQPKKTTTPPSTPLTVTPLIRGFTAQPHTVEPQAKTQASSTNEVESSISKQETLDLQTQLERASRCGHNLGRMQAKINRPSSIQPKLTIGQPGDKYEQEADRVADRVMAMPVSPVQPKIQRQAQEEEEQVQAKSVDIISPPIQLQAEEEEQVQTKAEPIAPLIQRQEVAEEEEQVQTKPLSTSITPAIQLQTEEKSVQAKAEAIATQNPSNGNTRSLESRLSAQKGSGSPLSNEVRTFMEPRFGVDFSQVKIHADSEAVQMNRELNAQAFAHGRDIYFGAGKYNPSLSEGKRLLAHELTHVVQQTGAVQLKDERTVVQRQPLLVNPLSSRIQRSWWNCVKEGASNLGKGALEAASNPGSGATDTLRRKLLSPVAQLAKRITGYPLLTVIIGRDPINDEVVERNATNLIRGILSFVPGGDGMFSNLQQSGAIERTAAWLNQEIARLNLTWNAIKGLFRSVWNSLSIGDLASPGSALERIKNIFLPPIGRLKNFAVAAGKKVLEFVFEGALKLAGGASTRVMQIVQRSGNLFMSIISNPVGFGGNLVKSVRGGFGQFSQNILTHLKSGLLGWLFGALAGAGLTMPGKLDLKGIVSIVLQLLGLTYNRLRGRLVQLIGEKRVARVEQAFDFLKTIATQGLAAAWQQIVEFAGNLQEMVIGGIRDWVARSVVGAAITKLVSMFNPAGAVVQAVIAIYNTVMFFIERAQQLAALANSVFDSINHVAAGNVSRAMTFVEQSMARSLPVIISFLARLVGLGNVSGQVRKIVGSVQGKIEAAVTKLASFIVGKAKGLLGGDKETAKQSERTAKQSEALQADDRTMQQKQADIHKAAQEADQLLRNDNMSSKLVKAHLSGIKTRYKMVSLELIVNSETDSEETVHIEGRINPTFLSARQTKKKTPQWPPLNLTWHENVAAPGQGHLIAKHVGVSNRYLLDRAFNEDGKAATRWLNLATAQDTTSNIINQQKTQINNWFEKKPNQLTLTLLYKGKVIGEGFRRYRQSSDSPPSSVIEQFSEAQVILKRGGPSGWYILTGYPTFS